MKIAIFGDSFGVNSFHESKSWVDLLSANFIVDNYCEGGASLYYSYDQFLTNHEKYSKIIFLVTCPGRLYLHNCKSTKHVGNFDTANFWHQQVLKAHTNEQTLLDRNIFSSAKNYYLYLQNEKFDNLIHNLLLEKLKLTRQDVLFIPNFSNSGNLGFVNNLSNASKIDFDHFNLNYSLTEYEDNRHCHMNKINHQILAAEILKYLSTGKFNLDDCVWQVDTSASFNEYFTKR